MGETRNVNYLDDIEGLWTYVYHSYSAVPKRHVGFIQYGNTADPTRSTNDVTHPDISYLKFLLAGKGDYQGFNGLFY